MEISMQDIKNLFESIDRYDIEETQDELISNGVLDSIAIMALVGAIEDKYNIEVDFDYMIPDNFKNFWTIRDVILKVLKKNY
ncbi:acyl carrier protein [Campylobacter jejuni]|nr:acyl carrier protein [Campylobacter jejuni]ECR1615982.1 acyl carrier protein [Campylobacter jejuni]